MITWRKSSHSGGGNVGGQDCVEVADLTPDLPTTQWLKSSHSGGGGAGGQDCVEVADLTPVIAVRDSKDPDGTKLALDATAWRALAHQIKNGHHDLA
ncbi:DUF397 domain-containing protein [Actinomadura sp. 1N219]|uniref:DUF397 domain-containing protein n=1 Tax=Actinomadura sp. 1N219 TaxID=3375152 RepID=UPI0037B66576